MRYPTNFWRNHKNFPYCKYNGFIKSIKEVHGMYCRNCGQAMAETDKVCGACGSKVNVGNSFCSNCGKQVDQNASICVHCGTEFKAPKEPKSKLVAGLLGIFLGGFGVHNFYLGYTKKAVIQCAVSSACLLLSCCTLGITAIGTVGIEIWGLVEGIMILCGKIDKDGEGNPLKG